MKISSVTVSDIRDELNLAAKNGELIRVEQQYLGKTESKTYRFKTGFPNGLKSHSVTAWYSTDFKKDRLYMSSSELANYISNVNSGRGSRHITYEIERVVPELEQVSLSHPSSKPTLSSIIKSAESNLPNIKGNHPPTTDFER